MMTRTSLDSTHLSTRPREEAERQEPGFTYFFVDVDKCNMCGDSSPRHKVLGKRLNKRQGLFPKRKVGITTTVLQCSRCGLIYTNPKPIPANVSQHYDVPPENYWKPEYFTLDKDYLKHHIDTFLRLYERPSGSDKLRALDVGAGLGKAVIALARAGFDVHGIEPSQSFYETAIQRMGIRRDQLSNVSIEDAAFDDNSFDFINMGAVVEHLYDPSAALRKAVGWLRPGGLIYVEVPSSSYLLSKLIRWWYRVCGADYVINTCPMHVPYHLYEFTRLSFEFHARNNGYEIARSYQFVGDVGLPRIIRSVLDGIMWATGTGMQLVVWLRKPSQPSASRS